MEYDSSLNPGKMDKLQKNQEIYNFKELNSLLDPLSNLIDEIDPYNTELLKGKVIIICRNF